MFNLGVLFILLTVGGNINYFVNGNEPEICDNGLMKCVQTGKCIPLSWKCDGDADCGNNDTSDESHCPPKTCADHEVICNDGSCIPDRWKCDGDVDCLSGEDENATICFIGKCENDNIKCDDGKCYNKKWQCDGVEDCEDGSDEKECEKTCEDDMFACDNGQCIAHTWTCDGDNDCLDKSDEKECKEKNCSVDEFKCSDSKKCIDIKWKCDGDFDCSDHSDENVNCTYNPIDPTEICNLNSEFQCVESKECIHLSWKCDGDPDCTDGSDEGDFCPYTCREDQFKCNDNHCIPDNLKCDNENDCLDSSDEWNCTKQVKCHEIGEFDCFGNDLKCIPINKVCDGHNDCDHREDEETALCKHKDPCEGKVCPHHSTCQKIPITYNKVNATCVCDGGYEWQNEEKFCKDINECKERGVCSQICVNTNGGYKCECRFGYTLEKHSFCKANGEVPWLYYANRRDIRKLRIDSRFEDIVVNATTNSVALDIDHEMNLMFYTDSGAEVIKSLKINNTEIGTEGHGMESQVIISNVEKSAFAADGIAVDWLYKHIYWTDTGSNKIKVATYDGQYVKTLINTGLDEPRAIALDPENGQMYWTDWGKEAKIERSGMDGSSRKTIIAKGNGLEWPNGLTIDYVDKRIYWIDSKLHKISSAKMDGSDYYHVLVDAKEIQRPFSIAVFEDSLYWTDWHTNSIKSVNKLLGHGTKTLSLGSYSVMGIKVYHALKQDRNLSSTAKTLCSNAQCEQLCLPSPLIANATQVVVCACSDGYKLKEDMRTCTKSSAVSTTTKPTTHKQTTPSKEVTTKKIVTTSSSVETTEGGYTILTTSVKPKNESEPHSGSEPTGKIALIVAVCVGVVFILFAVVAILMYRRYKNRNKKSMHFDNPVYRKTTTDDQCMIPDENVPPQMQRLTSHESV